MARVDEAKGWRGDGGGGKSLTKGQKRALAVALVAVIVLGVGIWWGSSPSGVELTRSSDGAEEPVDPGEGDVEDAETAEVEADGEAPATDEAVAEPTTVVTKVHVDGAVLVPGVYELSNVDPRVADAVAAAGGLTEDADTAAVNLAAQIHDADKVHIPRIEESAAPIEGVGEIPAGSSTVDAASPSTDTTAVGDSGASSGPVNINTASAEELTALPGIGEKTAEKIVADREAQGPFASPEDLMRVSGIGEKKFAQVRDLICV